MRSGFLFFYPVVLFLFSSCSLLNNDKMKAGNNIVVKYMNLNSIYASVLKRNNQAMQVMESKDIIVKSITELEEQLLITDKDREKIIKKLKNNREKLLEYEKEEAYLKAKILDQINSAVKKVSKRLDADYVLNIGDEVVYAKKKYDITEEIIREIIKLEKRRAPASR